MPIASSGQASTQSWQAWQAEGAVTNACRPPCAQAFMRPIHESAERSAFESVPIVKTSYGHTRTQSSFPSQRFRSMTGATVPGVPERSLEATGLESDTRA
jgi:hypothetical protein